jgi:hypothetical protein
MTGYVMGKQKKHGIRFGEVHGLPKCFQSIVYGNLELGSVPDLTAFDMLRREGERMKSRSARMFVASGF